LSFNSLKINISLPCVYIYIYIYISPLYFFSPSTLSLSGSVLVWKRRSIRALSELQLNKRVGNMQSTFSMTKAMWQLFATSKGQSNTYRNCIQQCFVQIHESTTSLSLSQKTKILLTVYIYIYKSLEINSILYKQNNMPGTFVFLADVAPFILCMHGCEEINQDITSSVFLLISASSRQYSLL
jgi:hypothetical protein